jgi:hypothetical protein
MKRNLCLSWFFSSFPQSRLHLLCTIPPPAIGMNAWTPTRHGLKQRLRQKLAPMPGCMVISPPLRRRPNTNGLWPTLAVRLRLTIGSVVIATSILVPNLPAGTGSLAKHEATQTGFRASQAAFTRTPSNSMMMRELIRCLATGTIWIGTTRNLDILLNTPIPSLSPARFGCSDQA